MWNREPPISRLKAYRNEKENELFNCTFNEHLNDCTDAEDASITNAETDAQEATTVKVNWASVQ